VFDQYRRLPFVRSITWAALRFSVYMTVFVIELGAKLHDFVFGKTPEARTHHAFHSEMEYA
jgi:hypothetical protein